MAESIPDRQWKYLPSYVGHALIGFSTSIGIIYGGVWRTLAIVGIAIQLVYQYVEFLRRRDTPARDVADMTAGYYLGIGAVALMLWFGSRRR